MVEFDSIKTALMRKTSATRVFFRDDDGGWANERLLALAQGFRDARLVLDIAVIPDAIETDTPLTGLVGAHGDSRFIRYHQHGYAHLNHQQHGRKSEFGDERSLDAMRHDIAIGRDRLKQYFGDLIEPIFTPPWNRCSQDCATALAELGFLALSRIAGSERLEYGDLVDVSVAVDWQKKHKLNPLSDEEFDDYVAMHIAENDTLGVMLHHELMDDRARDRFFRFTDLLRESGRVEFTSMMELATLQQQNPLCSP